MGIELVNQCWNLKTITTQNPINFKIQNTMDIRPAIISDLDQLTSLFEGYRTFYRKASEPMAARKFISDRLENSDSKIFVCENPEGQLTGFVQLYPIFSSTRMKRLWLLNDLFVRPDTRGQGISKKLITRAKQLATETNAAGLLLETEVSNRIGNQLYPKTGFKLIEGSNFYEWANEF